MSYHSSRSSVLRFCVSTCLLATVISNVIIGKRNPRTIQVQLSEIWADFKENYNKIYSSSELESSHKRIFAQNLERILQHNKEFDEGKQTFKVHVNEHSDEDREEISKRMLGFVLNPESSATAGSIQNDEVEPIDVSQLPESVDWRESPFFKFTPIKSQGDCGSCWAFTTTGILEAYNYNKTGKLIPLSEQNLIDCDRNATGCDGGDFNTAFRYVQQHGIAGQADYPYVPFTRSACQSKQTVITSLSELVNLNANGNEDLLKYVVATRGPVAAGMNGNTFGFIYYRSGVYADGSCRRNLLNHAVVIVGYGVDKATGMKYWLVRNSWSDQWGEKGHGRIAMQYNQCGIANHVSYPVL